MFEKGYVSRSQKVAEQLNLHRAQVTLEQARSKREVLVKFVSKKVESPSLKIDLAKAREEERLRSLELEVAKLAEAELERRLLRSK